MSKNYDLEVLKYELMAATLSHRNCCVEPTVANVCVSKNESNPEKKYTIRDLEVMKYELLASAISHSLMKPASHY